MVANNRSTSPMKKTLIALVCVIASLNTSAQKEYFITSRDQTKLRVREFGAGEPLVILAGGPGLNADYLRPVWENLSSNFRCIVLDQRGTGKSTVSSVDSVSMSMKNYVNDLIGLQEYLKLDKVTLLGHSWGGMLAMEYASKQPQRIKKLLLIGSGGPTGKFFTYFGANIMMRLHERDLKELALLDSLNKRSLPALYPGYFFDRSMALKAKEATDFDALWGQPKVNQYTVSSYISRDARRKDSLKDYRGIVHIIQGRQDPIGESTAFEIKEGLPQSQISFIEKCGHMPWLENEEQRREFYDLLNKALK